MIQYFLALKSTVALRSFKNVLRLSNQPCKDKNAVPTPQPPASESADGFCNEASNPDLHPGGWRRRVLHTENT
ncbi:hypothetical protein OAF83_02435 [Rubripirellula sp.]|nr:hypothetical protein [Rubripirellula sp.]MDB4749742.1 hypothetical protein [Rubripirellula sp.]